MWKQFIICRYITTVCVSSRPWLWAECLPGPACAVARWRGLTVPLVTLSDGHSWQSTHSAVTSSAVAAGEDCQQLTDGRRAAAADWVVLCSVDPVNDPITSHQWPVLLQFRNTMNRLPVCQGSNMIYWLCTLQRRMQRTHCSDVYQRKVAIALAGEYLG